MLGAVMPHARCMRVLREIYPVYDAENKGFYCYKPGNISRSSVPTGILITTPEKKDITTMLQINSIVFDVILCILARAGNFVQHRVRLLQYNLWREALNINNLPAVC